MPGPKDVDVDWTGRAGTGRGLRLPYASTQECKVIFGPAGHALPQLPITVNEEGFLVAQSDFHEPVGPAYWERG